ncbi:hypothetical protein C8J57DRAFT_472082 [Mycena rebaudengoi]|nr:hypothetical protein C8J57DRAFT_472082 [Mycena rebaudengoi]
MSTPGTTTVFGRRCSRGEDGKHPIRWAELVGEHLRSIPSMSASGVNSTWHRITPGPDDETAYGVSATASGNTVVAAFQSNNGKGQVFATFFDPSSGKWLDHKDVGQTTSHTPAVAILDKVVNCVFASHDSKSEVLWVQRAVG